MGATCCSNTIKKSTDDDNQTKPKSTKTHISLSNNSIDVADDINNKNIHYHQIKKSTEFDTEIKEEIDDEVNIPLNTSDQVSNDDTSDAHSDLTNFYPNLK